MTGGSGRRLATDIRETVPRTPGVYAFLGAGGRLLYVGKSVNLRQRMGSYFGPDPLVKEPNLGRLVAGIQGFAWWQTRSELLALLLEDVLIKEHLPAFNTRQREFQENRYLELTDDEFPACLIVEHARDFGARGVFGPLKDKYFAATLRDILHETLGIRTCREPEPVSHCLEHDIGRCAGPCRGAIGPEKYGELVSVARDFLRGDARAVLDRLVEMRERAAARRSYEEAARLRDAIDLCRRFEAQQRFVRRFADGDCTVRCDEDGIEYRFAKGALIAPRPVVSDRGTSAHDATPGRAGFDADGAGRRAVAALRRSPSADRRFLADRARIVGAWVRRRNGACLIRFTEAEGVVQPLW
jgi:excinuclease UvrABC nuclease subunit